MAPPSSGRYSRPTWTWVGFGLAIGGAVFGVAVYALSGARPQRADLDGFIDGDAPAWYSPPLLARLRSNVPAPLPSPERVPEVGPPTPSTAADSTGPVLFAYDGTELAAFAIEQAAATLPPRTAALVVCVWQPVDVGFAPADGTHFNADRATEVRLAAERTAADGASLAEAAGFLVSSRAVEAAPTWKGIVGTADEHNASLIVLGPHRRNGLLGHLQGSVAAAVVAHTATPVLIVPQPAISH